VVRTRHAGSRRDLEHIGLLRNGSGSIGPDHLANRVIATSYPTGRLTLDLDSRARAAEAVLVANDVVMDRGPIGRAPYFKKRRADEVVDENTAWVDSTCTCHVAIT